MNCLLLACYLKNNHQSNEKTISERRNGWLTDDRYSLVYRVGAE